MPWLILIISFFLSCGKNGENNTGEVRYFLEREASSTITNSLYLKASGEFKPSFSISGKGFKASVPSDTRLPYQEKIDLTAETFGEVKIDITLYQENDKPYLSDTIAWKSSGEVPPKPIVYFSEVVSADAYVYLVFPKVLLRGKNTKEVWVEGDLAESPEGSYFTIPSDDQVLIQLSEGDGIKHLRVRYRNIFGAHSEWEDLSIEKKSIGPQNCKATPVAYKTASGYIRTRIEAENDGPLLYKVIGDVASFRDYTQFESTTEEWINLSAGEGNKNIVVKIKDLAGNFCPDLPLQITYDSSYVPGRVTIEGQPYWTDDPEVMALPEYDQLEGDQIEMLITGSVLPSSQTFQWIPYSERVPVTLTPHNGTRHILVEFRKDGASMVEVTSSVFLRPYIFAQGSTSPFQIYIGEILGTKSVTIEGCLENYTKVPYQAAYACTVVGVRPLNFAVVYEFLDGTEIRRSMVY